MQHATCKFSDFTFPSGLARSGTRLPRTCLCIPISAAWGFWRPIKCTCEYNDVKLACTEYLNAQRTLHVTFLCYITISERVGRGAARAPASGVIGNAAESCHFRFKGIQNGPTCHRVRIDSTPSIHQLGLTFYPKSRVHSLLLKSNTKTAKYLLFCAKLPFISYRTFRPTNGTVKNMQRHHLLSV